MALGGYRHLIRRLVGLVVLLGFAAGGLYYWKARPTGAPGLPSLPAPLSAVADNLRDAAISTAVRTAFALNRSTARLSIDVATRDAVVRLRGNVPDEAARATAQRLAENVPEVALVASELEVRASTSTLPGRSLIESLDDEKLALQVRLALSLNRKLAGHGLAVKAVAGEVALSGEVRTAEQRALAREVARETPGVSGVTDVIRIRGQATGRP